MAVSAPMHPRKLIPNIVIIPALLVGCTSGSGGKSSATSATQSSTAGTPSTSDLSLPVLHEAFEAPPCDQNTTTGMEGCAEKQTLAADAKVNALVRQLWTNDDAQGRQLLAAAQRLWVQYRDAACASDADTFRDGSERGVEYAGCAAALTQERAKDLTDQRATANQGR